MWNRTDFVIDVIYRSHRGGYLCLRNVAGFSDGFGTQKSRLYMTWPAKPHTRPACLCGWWFEDLRSIRSNQSYLASGPQDSFVQAFNGIAAVWNPYLLVAFSTQSIGKTMSFLFNWPKKTIVQTVKSAGGQTHVEVDWISNKASIEKQRSYLACEQSAAIHRAVLGAEQREEK